MVLSLFYEAEAPLSGRYRKVLGWEVPVGFGAGRVPRPSLVAGGSASSSHTFFLPPPRPPQTWGRDMGGSSSKQEWGPDPGWGVLNGDVTESGLGGQGGLPAPSQPTLAKAPASTYLKLNPGRPAALDARVHAEAAVPRAGLWSRPATSWCWQQQRVLRPL